MVNLVNPIKQHAKTHTATLQVMLLEEIKFSTAHGKFSGRFINAVMTAHASSIAEYGRVAISNNFTLGSGITQYASTNSVWKHLF